MDGSLLASAGRPASVQHSFTSSINGNNALRASPNAKCILIHTKLVQTLLLEYCLPVKGNTTQSNDCSLVLDLALVGFAVVHLDDGDQQSQHRVKHFQIQVSFGPHDCALIHRSFHA